MQWIDIQRVVATEKHMQLIVGIVVGSIFTFGTTQIVEIHFTIVIVQLMLAAYKYRNVEAPSDFAMDHITLTQHILLALLFEAGSHIALVVTAVRQIAAYVKLKGIIAKASHHMRQIRV